MDSPHPPHPQTNEFRNTAFGDLTPFLTRAFAIADPFRVKEVPRMPNIKSAKKRVLVSKTRAARNKSANSALKTAIKKAHAAVETDAADKEVVVRAAIKKVDQAQAKGLLHKNNAARKKSALAKFINE